MSLTPNIDLDPTFRSALKFLHSPSPDSAEKIRNTLDEIIKVRFGSSKMLANTLNKKILAEESAFPDTRKGKLKMMESKPIPVTDDTTSPIEIEAESDDGIAEAQTILVEVPEEMDTIDDPAIEEDHFKELEDLMCIVCRQMDVSVRNRLVECLDCHSLYHQDCHKPIISETDVNDTSWRCTMCKTAKIPIIPTTTTSNTTSSTSSSSPSNPPTTKSSHSSSNYTKSSKNYESSSSSSSSSESRKSKSSSRSSPKPTKSSSSSSSSKSNSSTRVETSPSRTSSERLSNSGSGSGGGGSGSTTKSSSSTTITPNINIISADKRLQIMKKKAAKLHETKRKHK